MKENYNVDLKNAILNELETFVKNHASDTVYGMAMVMGQLGNYLGLAFATENGLEKISTKYLNHKTSNWQEQRLYTDIENLKTWLKWANPDDGWHYVDFSEKHCIDKYLEELTKEISAEEINKEIEKNCIQALQNKEFEKFDIIFGITYGEDPDDFLRTATQINTLEKVKQLWRDTKAARELDC